MLTDDLIRKIDNALGELSAYCDHEELVPSCESCRADMAREEFSRQCEGGGFVAQFDAIEHVQRLAYLAHQDLARTLGNVQIAREKLDNEKSGEVRLPGNQRRKAVETVEVGPQQAERLRATQRALQACIRAARERGEA